MRTERLSAAFEFATFVHGDSKKPGTDIPMIYHPIAVASLVIQYGGDEDQAVAALLHDTPATHRVSRNDLTQRFGERVARIVSNFADLGSREAYVNQLRRLTGESILVIACEELHDGRELVHDLRYRGSSVWKRYSETPAQIVAYYRELKKVVEAKIFQRGLIAEFELMVLSLENLLPSPAHFDSDLRLKDSHSRN